MSKSAKRKLQIADVLRESGAVLWMRDAETIRFRYVSEGIEDVLGYPPSRFIEDDGFWEATIVPDERSVTMDRMQEILKQGTGGSVNYHAIHANGSLILLVDFVAASRARKVVAGITSVAANDMVRATGWQSGAGEREAQEFQQRQSLKMEAVGRLAEGIAHDFNNILTVITSYSQLLLSRFPPDDPGRADVSEIRGAANRAISLIRQLLTFSRRSQGEQHTIDLRAALLETQKMLQQTFSSQIEIIVLAKPEAEYCRADRGQLDQVLVNLALNARDAMPQGGTLSFELGTTIVEKEFARRHLDADTLPGEYVVLSVRDTGQGIDAHIRERVFEPFFTTKRPGKGTGLGLSTVYGIVKQHGGAITLASDSGSGTTFRIYLPRAPQPSSNETVPPLALTS
ncbi:MAG: PAS domain-containing protein [Anaerolineae bacterium]|nr:PAS domain-containing protein [Gemmatimonadaceae bacterium]